MLHTQVPGQKITRSSPKMRMMYVEQKKIVHYLQLQPSFGDNRLGIRVNHFAGGSIIQGRSFDVLMKREKL